MRLNLAVFSALILLVWSFISLADDTRPEIRLSYEMSSAMPDHLAYRDWLGYVEHELNESESSAEDFIIFRFQIPETEERVEIARAALAVFENSIADMKRDTFAARLENTCDAAMAENWSKDDYYRAMDREDDLNDAIAAKNYRYALLQLDQETGTLLQEELQRHKSSMHLVRYDHKAVWESQSPNEDLAKRFDQQCEQLKSEQYQILGGEER